MVDSMTITFERTTENGWIRVGYGTHGEYLAGWVRQDSSGHWQAEGLDGTITGPYASRTAAAFTVLAAYFNTTVYDAAPV